MSCLHSLNIQRSGQQYRCELLAIPTFADLSEQWLSVENEADNSFFLSWTWMHAWLEAIKPDAKLLRVYAQEELVGIAFFVVKATRRGLAQTLYLNQTGDEAKDQMWIEYNEVLAKTAQYEDVQSVSAEFIAREMQWDECRIGASKTSSLQTIAKHLQLPKHVAWETYTYGIVLQRTSNYLDTLSRNTRYQINRSFKQFMQQGSELELQFAESKAQALEYFEQAAPFHIKRWGDQPLESGFTNTYFLAFHHTLIDSAWSQDQVALARLQHADEVLGYLYFFTYKGVVSFYLSGLAAAGNAKLKPGLCAHTLCVQHFKDLGFRYYDLLGGDDRYKQNLAIQKDLLQQVSFTKKTPVLAAEHLARKVKNVLTGNKT